MLQEAVAFCDSGRCNFAVYGHVWGSERVKDDVGPEIAKHWRGVLPVDDIAEVRVCERDEERKTRGGGARSKRRADKDAQHPVTSEARSRSRRRC